MSVILDRSIEVSENAIALRRGWSSLTDAEKSNRFREASRKARRRGRQVFGTFGAGPLRAAESAASTIFIGIFFALGIALSLLMLAAILVLLTCGLACYA